MVKRLHHFHPMSPHFNNLLWEGFNWPCFFISEYVSDSRVYIRILAAPRLKSAPGVLLWWKDFHMQTTRLLTSQNTSCRCSLHCRTHSSWWSSCWQRLRPYWSFWGCQLRSGPECLPLWEAENTRGTNGYWHSELKSVRYSKRIQ